MASGNTFNVNAASAIALTRKLEETSRSAFPIAVRSTLNAAAFDMKTKTLQQAAKDNFIIRAPTFFRRFTTTNKAQGFDVNRMQSVVGFTNQGEEKAQTAVANMALQEEGGDIGTGIDYLKGARGGSLVRRVTRSNYFSKSRQVKGAFKRAKKPSSRFVASAYVSLREKKVMVFKGRDGRRFTMIVTSINKTAKGKLKINTKLLTVNRDNKPVNIRARHFNEAAASETMKKIPDFYLAEAQRQFAKALNKKP